MNFINFNEHIIDIPVNKYGGSEKKKTIIMDDGNMYMLKFPDPIREKGRDVSYINNVFSEYIGCNIFKIVGFDVQETVLGVYIDKEKIKIACACKDVRGDGESLVEMEKICLEYTDDTVPLTFSSIREVLSRMQFGNVDLIYEEYCKMHL